MAQEMSQLDAAIHGVYSRIDEAIDDILVDPSKATDFANAVRAESTAVTNAETETILRRAIALRKRGEDAGGLPRKHRNYRGRGSKPK